MLLSAARTKLPDHITESDHACARNLTIPLLLLIQNANCTHCPRSMQRAACQVMWTRNSTLEAAAATSDAASSHTRGCLTPHDLSHIRMSKRDYKETIVMLWFSLGVLVPSQSSSCLKFKPIVLHSITSIIKPQRTAPNRQPTHHLPPPSP